MTFAKVTIEVNKKENGAFVKVGERDIFVPMLSDAIKFMSADVKKDDKGVDMSEEGLPVYDNDNANWLQGAILAAVKAQARNRMKQGSADLKDNLKISTNWEELVAEGVRDGSGLALAREFKGAFADWIKTQGLSEAASNMLVTLVDKKAALVLQTLATKGKVKVRLEAYADAQTPETIEKYMRPLQAALDACEATEDPLAGI